MRRRLVLVVCTAVLAGPLAALASAGGPARGLVDGAGDPIGGVPVGGVVLP
jgi:hypothetical protein